MACPAKPAAWLAVAMLLAACGGTVTPAPTPTPVPEVSVGISAQPAAEMLARATIAQAGPLPFDLIPGSSDSGLSAAEARAAVIHLDFPPVPPTWWATQLGYEGIAFVVHRTVSVDDLSRQQLAELFSGREVSWSGVGGNARPVELVIPPDGDRLRAHFLSLVLPRSRVASTARLSATPFDTLEIVGQVPGSIGLVPLSVAASSDLRVVRIEGVEPSISTVADGSYPLRVQLAAMAPAEPDGAVREWLVRAQALLEE